MSTIGWILLFFCIALTGLILASNVYTRFLVKKMVVRKLEWLDFVLDTALAPPDWRIRHDRAMAKLSEWGGNDTEKLQKLKERAREDYLRRIDKLIRFAEVCTLVSDESEREIILKDLTLIRKDWKENGDALFTAGQ